MKLRLGACNYGIFLYCSFSHFFFLFALNMDYLARKQIITHMRESRSDYCGVLEPTWGEKGICKREGTAAS